MNERIDQIFEQALADFKTEHEYATIIVPNPLKERFAEMLIKECVGLAKLAQLSETSMDVIKEHFGVE